MMRRMLQLILAIQHGKGLEALRHGGSSLNV